MQELLLVDMVSTEWKNHTFMFIRYLIDVASQCVFGSFYRFSPLAHFEA